MTLISDGFAVVYGLLRRLRPLLVRSSTPSSNANLLLSIASSLGAVLQDGDGFEWFIDMVLKQFDWQIAMMFFSETASKGAQTPKVPTNGTDVDEPKCAVAPPLVNAVDLLWRRAVVEAKSPNICNRSNLLLATVLYVPKVSH